MIATIRHVTSGSGLKDSFKPLDFWWTETCMVSIYSKPDENYELIYEFFLSPRKLTWGIEISGMNFSLRSSSSSDDDNNNNTTCLLINVVPFKVTSLEIHAGSTAISLPFEALCEVQWLKLGTTFKPIFRLNWASGRAKSWCSPDN